MDQFRGCREMAKNVADFRHVLADFSVPSFRSNSVKEAAKTLANLRQEIAKFSLPSFRSSNSATEVAKVVANFRQELAFIEKKRNHRDVVKAMADFRHVLADFSVPPSPHPAQEINNLTIRGNEIKGWASVFGTLDEDNEIVDAGAFSATLAEYRRSGTLPKMLWQHFPTEPIGVWEDITENSTGLWVKGRILPTVQRGAEALALIAAGINFGLSIGFRTVRDRMISRVRHIQAVKLMEISLVTFPSNPDALLVTGKESECHAAVKVLATLRRDLADLSMTSFQ